MNHKLWSCVELITLPVDLCFAYLFLTAALQLKAHGQLTERRYRNGAGNPSDLAFAAGNADLLVPQGHGNQKGEVEEVKKGKEGGRMEERTEAKEEE